MVDGVAQLLAVEEVREQVLHFRVHNGQQGHFKRASTKVEDEKVLLNSGTLLVETVHKDEKVLLNSGTLLVLGRLHIYT